MIVDLMRNDLAAIATVGSVEVGSLCALESYETVHQLVSEVGAELRPGVGLTDVFRALFPSGSVTGAPKIATMRLIRSLEPTQRGVYCGAVGVVGPAGARFNVAIRTVVVDRDTGTAVYGTGGGITWASDPASEYAELLTKADLLPSTAALT
jgi:para-aminobenzoate synthetase/4-amino-4-deoxychorismate lyase